MRATLEARELELMEANARLGDLATRDGLTQLANRRVFDERLAQELARARRHGAPLALLLLDIDHFKAFNDRYGHLRGDEVLCSVATILTENIRETDVAARYGGERRRTVARSRDHGEHRCRGVPAGDVGRARAHRSGRPADVRVEGGRARSGDGGRGDAGGVAAGQAAVAR